MIHRLYRPRHDARSETIWLTIYADLITNLALVFLALFGLTVMGDDALARAVQSMRLEDLTKISKDELKLEGIAPALQNQLPLSSEITIAAETGVVRLQFGESVLFESGRAKLKSSAKPLLRDVAAIMKTVPFTVVVEGHSDSVPIPAGGEFRDNWDLSLARAMSVVRVLAEEGGLEEKYIAAAAYGSNRPRGSNLTKNGRRLNRRVEIALFQDFQRAGAAAAPAAPKPAPKPLLQGSDIGAAIAQGMIR